MVFHKKSRMGKVKGISIEMDIVIGIIIIIRIIITSPITFRMRNNV